MIFGGNVFGYAFNNVIVAFETFFVNLLVVMG